MKWFTGAIIIVSTGAAFIWVLLLSTYGIEFYKYLRHYFYTHYAISTINKLSFFNQATLLQVSPSPVLLAKEVGMTIANKHGRLLLTELLNEFYFLLWWQNSCIELLRKTRDQFLMFQKVPWLHIMLEASE